MSDVTQILEALTAGESEAADALFAAVYSELRRMAAVQLAGEKPGQTLQPTALVHEAYLRMVSGASKWENRRHFFSVAAESMRRILIENARKKLRVKHGAGAGKEMLSNTLTAVDMPTQDLVELNDALSSLELADPSAAEVVKMRFFAGLQMDEIAGILSVSPRTVARNWTFARAWLHRHLNPA